MSDIIVVKADHDPDAGVWYTESSDVHGLRIEAGTLEVLVQRTPGAVRDLLEDDDCETYRDIPIKIIAHASTRVRIPEERDA